jgi:carbon monoxide dehydrogenase subunit G
MQFTGRYVIPAPREAVWAALNDVAVLRASLPGCETLEKADPTTFQGAMRLKIGPVSATFRGKVQLTELDAPQRCVLKGEGQGGVAGFAKGEAEVLLTPAAEGTALAYTAKAMVGGKLAQVGQRLLDGAVRQIADEFFARFSAEVTAIHTPSGEKIEESLTPMPIEAQAPDGAPGKREGLAPEIWVIGLIAIIVILLVLFGLVLT